MPISILPRNRKRGRRTIDGNCPNLWHCRGDRHCNTAGSGSNIDNGGPSTSAHSPQDFANQKFGFRTGNEHRRRDPKLQTAKLLRPEDILERLARSASSNEGLYIGDVALGEQPIAVDDLRYTRETQDRLDEPDRFFLA